MTGYLVDSNVWLALTLSGHAHHRLARDWLDAIEEPAAALFCRATQQTLLRLLTNSAVLAPYGNPPLTNKAAWEAYEALAADDRVASRTTEPRGVAAAWKTLSERDTASPKLWMDAYLAAFALCGRLRLVTTDTAFRQFQDVDVVLLGT